MNAIAEYILHPVFIFIPKSEVRWLAPLLVPPNLKKS